MSFLLLYENPYRERFYFVEAGDMHHSQKLGAIRLISTTTPDVTKARKFDTAPEAAAVLLEAGNPASWEILPVS